MRLETSMQMVNTNVIANFNIIALVYKSVHSNANHIKLKDNAKLK